MEKTTFLKIVAAFSMLIGCEKNKTRQPSQEPLIPSTSTSSPSPENSSPQLSVPATSPQATKTYQIRDALIRAGFPSYEISTMLCIGWCESNYNLEAIGDDGGANSIGRYNWGVFQINGVNFGTCGVQQGQQLFNLQTNVNCALKVREDQGFGAWPTYQYCKQPPSDPTQVRCS